MSVAVVVNFRSPERQPLYLPVATEAVFSHHWLPAAEKLGLQWIPLFETGVTVSAGDLPAVLAELAQIRAELARSRRTAALTARVDSITDALSALDPADLGEICIG